MGIRMDDQDGHSYSMKGHTPVIPGSGQRSRCSLMSAITNRGRLCFRVFKGQLNSDVFIDFLRRLKRQSDRKIFLIVDRHPVHRSGKTQMWIDNYAPKVRLIFLPAYSPDLNPDEMLNQDVKSNVVRRKRPPTLQHMIDNIRAYLRSRQRKKAVVKRYFQAPSVRCEALRKCQLFNAPRNVSRHRAFARKYSVVRRTKLYINGHEYAKCQLDQRGVAYESLDNGFLSCQDPNLLQHICNNLSAVHVRGFVNKWFARLPHPHPQEDHQAGYTYDLSKLHAEFALTHVFDHPLTGRVFFEQVLRENLDLGRPDQIQLIFDRRVTRRTPGRFRTRVITDGVSPSLYVNYKSSNIHQYR